MQDDLNDKGLCSLCREEMTSVHAEVGAGRVIHACAKCLDSAEENFIWICMSCANVFIRPKSLILARLKDPELLRAYRACADLRIIQGIERCVECDPGGIVEAVAGAKACGHSGSC